MKIGYLLRYYPTLTETFIYSEINGLLTRDLNIEILALGQRSDGMLQSNLPTCSTSYVGKNRLRRFLPLNSRGESWLIQHQRSKDVARLSWLRKHTIHLDHLHVHFAGEAAEMAYALHLDTGISYSVTTHAVDIFSPRAAWKEVLTHASTVISISQYNQEYLRSNGIESTVIHCGIDPQRWPTSPCPEGPLRALFIGRDVPKKGLDVLLDAFSRVPKPHQLHIISDCPPQTTENISFYPLLPYSEIRRQMQWCNVVILPCRIASNGDRDGIPVVLMEALASGRPVISTTLSGIEELINEQVGWLATPDCPHSLHECLQKATNSEQRTQKAKRSREHILSGSFVQKKQIKLLFDHFVTRI